MSVAAIIAYLAPLLPDLDIKEPTVVDLPAQKQQSAQQFFDALKPTFTTVGAATARLYPLTAQVSATIRPLPDAVYGVVRSEQRTWQGKAVATVIGFALEIRAASYQTLLETEDAVRTALLALNGVEIVGASDDYEEDAQLYLASLDIEMSAEVADVLVMEGAVKALQKPVCQNIYPLVEQEYIVLIIASTQTAVRERRDVIRDALTHWIEPNRDFMQYAEGQPLAMDCNLFVYVDIYKRTERRG